MDGFVCIGSLPQREVGLDRPRQQTVMVTPQQSKSHGPVQEQAWSTMTAIPHTGHSNRAPFLTAAFLETFGFAAVAAFAATPVFAGAAAFLGALAFFAAGVTAATLFFALTSVFFAGSFFGAAAAFTVFFTPSVFFVAIVFPLLQFGQ
jgi:hypothetical protein